MPRYKNAFKSPEYHEETIVDEDGTTIGTIRVKPSSILWKPSNARKFYSVSLTKFSEWITDSSTRATKTGR